MPRRIRCGIFCAVVSVERVTTPFDNEDKPLKSIVPLVVFLFFLSGVSALSQAPDLGKRTVQLVYHSDTHGYYLPCG